MRTGRHLAAFLVPICCGSQVRRPTVHATHLWSFHSNHHTSCTQEDDAAKTDGFFDMICKYQSQRLDEQRAVLPTCPPPSLRPSLPPPAAPAKKTSEDDQLLEMLFKLQHSRLNEQRCEMPSAPHLVSGAKRRGSGQQQPAHDGDDESDDVSSSEEEEEEEGEEEERRDQLGELKPAQVFLLYIDHQLPVVSYCRISLCFVNLSQECPMFC